MKRQGKLFQSKLSGTGYSTYTKAPADVKKLVDSLEFIDNYSDIQKVKKAIEKKGYSIELSMDGSIESLKKLPAKKVGYKSDRLNIVRTASTRMKDYLNKGYSRRDALINANKDAANIYGTKKPTSMHKDSKSHNVNISVVSGIKPFTLTQYLNQENPTRNNLVKLKTTDVQKGAFLSYGPDKIRYVVIKKLPQYTYVQLKGDDFLYTQDSDGNPNRKSVFLLSSK